jgi:hypothetical protein
MSGFISVQKLCVINYDEVLRKLIYFLLGKDKIFCNLGWQLDTSPNCGFEFCVNYDSILRRVIFFLMGDGIYHRLELPLELCQPQFKVNNVMPEIGGLFKQTATQVNTVFTQMEDNSPLGNMFTCKM